MLRQIWLDTFAGQVLSRNGNEERTELNPLMTTDLSFQAIRILLHTIESTANRYGKYIKPLLCVSADFYIRVFLRIYTSPYLCKRTSSKQSWVYQCTGCDTLTLQPLGIVKSNPSASNPNQVKFGIPTGPAVNSNCVHCHHRHHVIQFLMNAFAIGVKWNCC